MMRKLLWCMLLVPVVFMAGCASAEGTIRAGYDFSKLDRLAVVQVTGAVGGEGANTVADLLGAEFMARGYTMVERQNVQALLTEHNFQASNVTTKEGAVQAGQILNVRGLVVVNVNEFNENISLTARIIDAEDGGWAWTASGEGTTGRTLLTIAGAAVGAIAGAATFGHYGHHHHHYYGGTGTLVGAAAGGALGGVGGYAIAPKQLSQTRKIIKKMCDTLPPRGPVWTAG